MTNYERIKNMSVEEMAEWLEDVLSGSISSNLCYLCAKKDIGECGYFEKDSESRVTMCVRNRKLWLQSEVEE